MKRCILIVWVVLMLSVAGFGVKLASLPDIFSPNSMAVDDKQVYVVEKAVVFIYSLKDYSLKAKFGKAGEGPQEFRVSAGGEGVFVLPKKDVLLINSIGKLSFYSKDGKFIKEMKTPPGSSGAQGGPLFQPIDGKFVGMGVAIDQKNEEMGFSVNLFNDRMEKIKELKKIKFMKNRKMFLPMEFPIVYVWDNKIIMTGDKEGISIDMYDAEGNKVSSVHREYKSLKVTDKYKEDVYETFRTMPETKAFFEQIKQLIGFSDYFPAIQLFWAVDGRIYIMTYLEKDGKCEFFVFDFKGKLLKHVFLPVVYMYGIRTNPIAVKNDKLYQLIENPDEEEWELHAVEIR